MKRARFASLDEAQGEDEAQAQAHFNNKVEELYQLAGTLALETTTGKRNCDKIVQLDDKIQIFTMMHAEDFSISARLEGAFNEIRLLAEDCRNEKNKHIHRNVHQFLNVNEIATTGSLSKDRSFNFLDHKCPNDLPGGYVRPIVVDKAADCKKHCAWDMKWCKPGSGEHETCCYKHWSYISRETNMGKLRARVLTQLRLSIRLKDYDALKRQVNNINRTIVFPFLLDGKTMTKIRQAGWDMYEILFGKGDTDHNMWNATCTYISDGATMSKSLIGDAMSKKREDIVTKLLELPVLHILSNELLYACRNGRQNILLKVISQGWDVNKEVEVVHLDLTTYLLVAASKHGQPIIVRTLLENGAQHVEEALEETCGNRKYAANEEVVRLLIDALKKKDPTEYEYILSDTLFSTNMETVPLNIIQLLVTEGADPNSAQLMLAICHGRKDIVTYLLSVPSILVNQKGFHIDRLTALNIATIAEEALQEKMDDLQENGDNLINAQVHRVQQKLEDIRDILTQLRQHGAELGVENVTDSVRSRVKRKMKKMLG
jgi:hypothetical protein